MNLLVVGAQPGSLGEAVAAAAASQGHDVVTGGINGEDLYLNVLTTDDWLMAFSGHDVDAVVCTAGINEPAQDGSLNEGEWFAGWMRRSLTVNTIGPMNVLMWFLEYLRNNEKEGAQFVAISSNSARIARSNSMAYCASKAALSMAIRVAAREAKGHPAIIYGYELGLLQGTPMSRATEQRFGPAQTRMPGAPGGLPVGAVAAQIVAGLGVGGMALNGSLIRLDAGEQ